MTEPLGEGAGAMAQAQIQALIKNAQSLGIVWSLRPATVAGYDGSVALAVMDGDTEPIAVTPMVSALYGGQRVYVITIPPGGNYAIPMPVVSDLYAGPAGATGTIITSAGLEVAIPAAQWGSGTEPTAHVGAGRIARVAIDFSDQLSTATDSLFIVRLREGSASTTGTVVASWRVASTSAAVDIESTTVRGYIKNTSLTATTDQVLSLTIQRSSGAASVSIFADANNPFTVDIRDYGSIADNPGMAARIIAL